MYKFEANKIYFYKRKTKMFCKNNKKQTINFKETIHSISQYDLYKIVNYRYLMM